MAKALLGFERGVSVLAQVIGFARELRSVVDLARDNGALEDAVLRDRLAALKVELEVMRWQALRGLSGDTPGGDSVFKLVWASWHQRLGEAAMDVRGLDGLVARPATDEELDRFLKDWPQIDPSTGLHLLGDELLIKAREAMLVAVVAGKPAVIGSRSAASDARNGATASWDRSEFQPRPSTRRTQKRGQHGNSGALSTR